MRWYHPREQWCCSEPQGRAGQRAESEWTTDVFVFVIDPSIMQHQVTGEPCAARTNSCNSSFWFSSVKFLSQCCIFYLLSSCPSVGWFYLISPLFWPQSCNHGKNATKPAAGGREARTFCTCLRRNNSPDQQVAVLRNQKTADIQTVAAWKVVTVTELMKSNFYIQWAKQPIRVVSLVTSSLF